MTVYTVGTRATVYHTTPECGRLARGDIDIREVSKEQAERRDLDLCQMCAGEWTTKDNPGGNISQLERILRKQEAEL